MLMSAVPSVSVFAEDTSECYPYTLFASSNDDGAITVNAGNFCVNGNVAVNGTITSSGNMNINGTKTEEAGLEMMYIFDRLDATYFSSDNVEFHEEDYTLEEMNINVNSPLEVIGEAELTGNININSALKALKNVELYGEVKNTNNSVIYSKYGDIIIDSANVNLNGLVYAPFGNVVITAQNLNLNNVVIIANTITLNCPNVNANYSSSAAKLVGTVSEPLDIPVEEWTYMKDENENDFPDFFEDVCNWDILKDTDNDLIPDAVEIWLGSNQLLLDSDEDGLDDYYEFFISLTDLTKSDTDENGISDGDEDLDFDGLVNSQEYELKSHPLYLDSDGDGLNDYEETQIYMTNPNLKDTDEDGAFDNWEIKNGYNPNEHNELFSINASDASENVTATVSLNVSGEQVESLSVKKLENSIMFSDSMPGYIDCPFNFSIDGIFEQATITFIFNEELLNDETFVPAVYYYNEDTQLLEELPTEINGNTATAITTHFSTYILLNKTKYNSAWQIIKSSNNKSNISTINLAFVVDTSGSMNATKLHVAKNVIKTFTSKISNNTITTNLSLISFSNEAHVIRGLSNDYESFLNGVNSLTSGGGTAIYSGLDKAITTLNPIGINYSNKYDAIILLTDGYDEPTVDYSVYENYILKAKKAGINIYTVGVGTIDELLLDKLSKNTDGKSFFADNVANLYTIYENIESEIIDYTTDSNNDGISDYYTKLLCDGTLRIGTQYNMFKDISYEEFNSNDDYDLDGIKNKDEIKIITDENTNRVYIQLISNPVKKDSDNDGILDNLDRAPLDATMGIIAYQTEADDYKLKQLKLFERPDDFKYADKSLENLLSIQYMDLADFNKKEDYYKETWKSLIRLASSGDLENVASDMVDHFLDGTGTDYNNPILTKEISNHKNTEKYAEAFSEQFNKFIAENNGDLTSLNYYNYDNRQNAPLVKKMKTEIENGNKNLNEPTFTEIFSGLGICVDSLYGNRVEVISYEFDGTNYKYKLKFTMYDIYGLNEDDLTKGTKIHPPFGSVNLPNLNIGSGFKSWYILQHLDDYNGAYQPYINYMTFEKIFEGSIS